MDWIQTITDALSWTGNGIASVTAWIIVQLGNLSIKISPLGAKIINAIVFLSLLYVLIKFVQITSKPLKWIIGILLVLLLISTIISFSL